MSDAVYTIGPPNRPSIHHDNGFLDTFPRRAPVEDDYARLRRWKRTLFLGEAGQGVPFVPHNDIPDGLAAYRHFLFGKGRDRVFSYERFVAGDPSGKTVLENAILDARQGAEQVHATHFGSTGAASSTFQITGTALSVGGQNPRFPYPATENWQKAIGAHVIWLSADVEVSGAAGAQTYSMNLTLHAEDRYNFNPKAHDIATGIPDSDNGVFETTGLAMQYMNRGTLTRRVVWTGSTTAPSAVTGEPGRQRKPSDNVRLRNRL